MNRERRKKLEWNNQVIDFLIEQINKMTLEEVRDEEQDAFDNMPEGLQSSERGCTMENNIEILDNVIDKLDEIQDMLIDLSVDLDEVE